MITTLPNTLLKEIRHHFVRMSSRGEAGWSAGKEDEDVITGDLLGGLRTQKVMTSRSNHSWEISYNKFRGRGKGAYEKESGADGIIQVEIFDSKKKSLFRKGMLFQAKKLIGQQRLDVVDQVNKMEGLASGISAIFVYSELGYFALDSKKYLKNKSYSRDRVKIGDFLSNEFMNCQVGLAETFYSFSDGYLTVTDTLGRTSRHLTTLKAGLTLSITRP
jgi:hypothetical protein